MFILENEILPIGEKIKSIRKSLGLKQIDLTEGKISRNLISYIESGKTNLSKQNADIIANVLMNEIKEQDLKYEITPEYLLLDENGQGKVLIYKQIKKAKETIDSDNEEFFKNIDEAKKVLKKCNLPKESSLVYELLGDHYFNKTDMTNAYLNYLNSLKNNNELEDSGYKSAQLVYKMAKCAINEKNYLSAIDMNNYAVFLLDRTNLKDTIYFNCLLNIAVCYKRLKKYDEALKYIRQIEAEFLELPYKNIIELKTFEGIIYMRKNDFHESEKILKSIIEISKKNDDFTVNLEAQCRLLELYIKKKEYKEAIDLGDYIIQSFDDISSKDLVVVFKSIGISYLKLKEYDLSEKFLLRALNEANKENIWSLKTEIYYDLLNIYLITEESYLLLSLVKEIRVNYPEVKKISTENEIKKMDMLIVKLSKLLIDIDKNISKELLNMILEGDCGD